MKRQACTWGENKYNIEVNGNPLKTDDNVVETIKKKDVDVTGDILGKSNVIDDFVAELVNAMIKRQINIHENDVNLNAIGDEEAYLIYAIDEARRKA